MATLKIPKSYDQGNILVADDEPEHVDWLVDYLKAKGFQVTLATNVAEAMNAIEKTNYRAYIIDLNIPLGGWVPDPPPPSETYDIYQGLYIIRASRTQGNAGARVIAYSAHYNEQIAADIKHLYCEYIIKGRARELKTDIERLLSHDPRAAKP
jgi:CheY-like chemotaxis protein